MKLEKINREKEFLYWLCHIEGVGAIKIERLREMAGSYESLYNIEEKGILYQKILSENILTEREISHFLESRQKLDFYIEEYHSLEERRIKFITPLDDNYPERLNYIYGRPMGLYLRGELPADNQPAAAIIGARNCSEYGRQMAEYLGDGLSECGIQIVSGLAAGIDGAGHRGALRRGHKTYGVLGCGINICYPREHYNLFEEMQELGGILTEFPLGEQPKPQNFPMRNRIISGLSDLILVIEAKEKSGSLITAGIALEQGKDIFALPGRVTDVLSRGCNQLIRDGAGILTALDDIIDYFGINNDKMVRDAEKNMKGLAKTEKMVYSCLDLQPKCLEQIVKDSGLPLRQCISSLLELKLNGYILEVSNQYYIRKL